MKKLILLSPLIVFIVFFLFVSNIKSQVADDDYIFRGQYNPLTYGCPPGYPVQYISSGAADLGLNRVATCVKDNDGITTNNDLVVADSTCPPSHAFIRNTSEHIALNNLLTCAKSGSGALPAIALGQADATGGITCPAQSGATLIGTWANEHIALNNVTTCRYSIAPPPPPPPPAGVPPEPPPAGGGGSQCSDGIDNNGDGLIDWPADPNCSSASDNTEIRTRIREVAP